MTYFFCSSLVFGLGGARMWTGNRIEPMSELRRRQSHFKGRCFCCGSPHLEMLDEGMTMKQLSNLLCKGRRFLHNMHR